MAKEWGVRPKGAQKESGDGDIAAPEGLVWIKVPPGLASSPMRQVEWLFKT